MFGVDTDAADRLQHTAVVSNFIGTVSFSLALRQFLLL